MEPSNNPGSMEGAPQPMPTPETDSPNQGETVGETGPAPQEVAPQSREGANQNAGMTLPPVVTQTTTPVADPVQPVQQQPVAAPVTGNGPAVANDVDLIEKEWVNKAKGIIHQTRQDPHQQEKEVSQLQADYLKKRYGKDIKPAK